MKNGHDVAVICNGIFFKYFLAGMGSFPQLQQNFIPPPLHLRMLGGFSHLSAFAGITPIMLVLVGINFGAQISISCDHSLRHLTTGQERVLRKTALM